MFRWGSVLNRVPYSALISRNLNFADSCLQSFRWINFAVPFALPQVLSKLPHLQCVSWYTHAHTPYYHAHKLIWQLFIRASRNRRLVRHRYCTRKNSSSKWAIRMNYGSVDQLVKGTSVEAWLRQLLLNTFFLALLVPRSYFGRDSWLGRPARYGRALAGVGNFRWIIFAEAVVSAKTAKFKSHEI